jgi:hypothetical protein
VNPFQSLREYEEFIYTLPQQFHFIHASTLVVVRRGHVFAILSGEIRFRAGYRLAIQEHFTFDEGPVVLQRYSYEVWHGEEELYWYDSQPHPHDPTLASTHPHHKHVPPDIKHNRIPAPGLSFTQPNLPILIQEIEHILQLSAGADRAV